MQIPCIGIELSRENRRVVHIEESRLNNLIRIVYVIMKLQFI